jgi:DNA polymerase III subunit delta
MSDFDKIAKDLRNKVYRPVYFFMGEEPYFIDQLSTQIEEQVLQEMEKEFDQTVLYGRDVDVSTVLSAAKRFPMMSSYQVVIVKEAQNIRDLVGREKKSDGDEDDGEEAADGKDKSKAKSPLLHYIEQPQKSTILVFCYKYKKLDKRTALYKALDKHGVIFESARLYENKVPDWIVSYLRGKNFTINPRASMMLTEFLGADLAKIANELDKLIINLPEKSEVTVEHIQQNIGISKDYNVFELQNALGKKEVLKANQIVNYFSANEKDHPLVMTITALFGFFSKLILYHTTPDKSKNNIAAVLGVHPFFVGDYEMAARHYPLEKLKQIASFLQEYDLKSKGVDNVSASQGELLKELVFKILHC